MRIEGFFRTLKKAAPTVRAHQFQGTAGRSGRVAGSGQPQLDFWAPQPAPV